jgi:hypothetical protein
LKAAHLFLLLLLALPAIVQGQWFYTTNNGSITITLYLGPGGAVTIPRTINGLPVTSIGAGVFGESGNLTSVTIPSSVSSIAGSAFSGCAKLASIMVDAQNPFYSSVDGVLFDKSETRLVEFPGGVGGSYTIPNGVISIGDDAFWTCRLRSVAIPSSVATIGEYAFYNCTSLVIVTIGSGVTSIGAGAFWDCQFLRCVFFQGNAPSCDLSPSGMSPFLSSIYATAYYLPGTTGWGTNFACLPAVLWSPPTYAYTTNNGALTITGVTGTGWGGAVTIPNTINGLPVTSIAAGAFTGSFSLISVTIPNSVTSIGDDAFYDCISLTTVAIGNAVTSIGQEAFWRCSSLVNIRIPDSVTSIGAGAFASCESLANVTIPDSMTNIAGFAFSACASLTSVTIPGSVTSVGYYAFYDCTSLTRVYFEGNAPGADSSVFRDDNYATIFYLPGTAGWDPLFADRPTAPWNPRVQTSNVSFGLRTNQFEFTIAGTSNLVIVVEACTNLANPTWYPLQTNTLNGNSLYFTDPNWTNYDSRFYRVTWP